MINSLFEYGAWNVKYKNINQDRWIDLKGEPGYWYADPMLFENDGDIYLFTEAFNLFHQIGEIAVSKFVNGEFTCPKPIIRNKYHMSYPCVFSYNSHIYMVPETSQNGTLEVYEPTESIFGEWKRKAVLLNNAKLVDTTVLVLKDDVYLIGYEESKNGYKTCIFNLDMNDFSLQTIEKYEHKDNIYRPAGNIFVKDKKYYRPVQYNKKVYGESMNVLEIYPEQNDWFGNIKKSIKVGGIDHLSQYDLRTHTLGVATDMVVIDTLTLEKSFFNPYYRFRRKARNGFYKIKRGEKLL